MEIVPPFTRCFAVLLLFRALFRFFRKNAENLESEQMISAESEDLLVNREKCMEQQEQMAVRELPVTWQQVVTVRYFFFFLLVL